MTERWPKHIPVSSSLGPQGAINNCGYRINEEYDGMVVSRITARECVGVKGSYVVDVEAVTLEEATNYYRSADEGDSVLTLNDLKQSSGPITVAKETGQPARTFIELNAMKMLRRAEGSRKQFWRVHIDALWEIAAFLPGQDFSADRMEENKIELFGIPVRVSSHAAPLGKQGDVKLVCDDGVIVLAERL